MKWLLLLLLLAAPAAAQDDRVVAHKRGGTAVVWLSSGGEFLADGDRSQFKARLNARIDSAFERGALRVKLVLWYPEVKREAPFRMARIAELCNERVNVSCVNLRSKCGKPRDIRAAKRCYDREVGN